VGELRSGSQILFIVGLASRGLPLVSLDPHKFPLSSLGAEEPKEIRTKPRPTITVKK